MPQQQQLRVSKAARARAVSAREGARLLGKDRATVARWIEQGCPVVSEARGGDAATERRPGE